MPTTMSREQAHKLVDRSPPQARRDDLMREIYVRQTIEQGLADSQAGLTKTVKEVRANEGHL